MRVRQKLIIDYYVGGLLHTCLKPLVYLAGFVLRRDHRLERVREICVMKLIGGGSLVIAYPSLLALKRTGRYRLQLLTTVSCVGFATNLDVFDEVIVIDDRNWRSLLGTSLRAMKRLFRHDALVDLEVHSRLSVLFSIAVCAVNRIGFYSASSYWRRGLSTHLLFFNRSSGIYHFYDQIAGMFGATVPPYDECRRTFRRSLGLPESRPPVGADGGRRVGLAPFCSGLSAERMLDARQWTQILTAAARSRTDSHMTVEIVGGPGDKAAGEELSRVLTAQPGFGGTLRPHNNCGALSLRESLLLIDQTEKLFCIDSGLMHFARLLGVPTESFWGPTSPAVLLRPVKDQTDTVHYFAMPCSPCVHVTNVAPCRGNNLCMKMHTDLALCAERNHAWLA